jgi:hypothetical protein
VTDRPAPGARILLLAALATLLLPGLGHFIAGERRRGAGFFGVVVLAFAAGIALGGSLPWPRAEQPLALVATVTTASNGFLFAGARALRLGSGDPGSATFEFGNGYLLTAGTMNLLLVVDLLARAARGTRWPVS